jgi:hypothetical protein
MQLLGLGAGGQVDNGRSILGKPAQERSQKRVEPEMKKVHSINQPEIDDLLHSAHKQFLGSHSVPLERGACRRQRQTLQKEDSQSLF